MHYSRWWQYGRLTRVRPVNAGRVCAVWGCPRKAAKRRLCRGHYDRRLATGSVGPAAFVAYPGPEAAFWAKVRKDPDHWVWTGARSSAGYGQIRIAGQLVYAHRFAYELLLGPIPDGMEIDHLCGVRSCVHPQHLEPVTKRENIQREHSRALLGS